MWAFASNSNLLTLYYVMYVIYKKHIIYNTWPLRQAQSEALRAFYFNSQSKNVYNFKVYR